MSDGTNGNVANSKIEELERKYQLLSKMVNDLGKSDNLQSISIAESNVRYSDMDKRVNELEKKHSEILSEFGKIKLTIAGAMGIVGFVVVASNVIVKFLK